MGCLVCLVHKLSAVQGLLVSIQSFACSEPAFSSSSVVESEQVLRSTVPPDQADSCQSVTLESFPSSSDVEEGSEVLSDRSESDESDFKDLWYQVCLVSAF